MALDGVSLTEMNDQAAESAHTAHICRLILLHTLRKKRRKKSIVVSRVPKEFTCLLVLPFQNLGRASGTSFFVNCRTTSFSNLGRASGASFFVGQVQNGRRTSKNSEFFWALVVR